MPRFFPRETFIALRARREAHQVANNILNPPLRVESPTPSVTGRKFDTDREQPLFAEPASVQCPRCERALFLNVGFEHEIECPYCGKTVSVSPPMLAPIRAQAHDPLPQKFATAVRRGACIVLAWIIASLLLGIFAALVL